VILSSQIWADDDIARPQIGDERLFDIGEKSLSVHRAVENHGRHDRVMAKSRCESGCFPANMGHGGAASLATRRAAIEARHLGVRRCFVDEDGPSRIGADSERSGLVLPRSILPCRPYHART
jgi:hypothetical protein